MVFVADDLGAWLVGLLADAGRKKLTTLVLGSEQERALRQAATAAVQGTAEEMRPSSSEPAGQLAMVISEVFREPMPGARLAGPVTLLEGLQAGIAGQLAVLDDAGLTGTGQSSADVLGVPGSVLAERLTGHLVREIMLRGSGGGPLTPLAGQLNHDLTHLQGQRLEGMLAELVSEVRDARAGPGNGTVAAGWPLGEVTDPFALEVHRPVQPDGPQPGLAALPVYVPREHDGELGRVVAAAAAGSSAIAVLVGGSSTGKTRACWEALRLLRDQKPAWQLWHPIDPSRPDAALRELPAIGSRTVVWLNEAQSYLNVGDGGLGERVAAGLRELLRDPARGPVLVLATLWLQFWDSLTTRPPNGADPHAQARELLAGQDIPVPAAFTPAQMRQLQETGDARLTRAAAAARDGQVAQFLAGAPELLARYRNAPPVARAVIHAAMDARRLGTSQALPHAFLEAAAPGYLSDSDWDQTTDDWLERALRYTAADCKGVRGPLTRIRPRTSEPDHPSADRGRPVYRLADYLDQVGRRDRRGQIPPASFWAAAAHAHPSDLTNLAEAALLRGLKREAAQLCKDAVARGDPYPACDLIYILQSVDPGDLRPATWAATHIPVHDPRPVAWLFDTLRGADAQEQAIMLARRAASHVALDDPSAVAELLETMRESNIREQVTPLLDRDPAGCVRLDDPPAVFQLLNELVRVDAQEQAVKLADRAIARVAIDNPGSVAWLLDALLRQRAMRHVANLVNRDPATQVSLDDPHAVANLLQALQRADAGEQVTTLLNRDPAAQAALEDPSAVAALLNALQKAGAGEQVTTLLNRDPATQASQSDPRAVIGLLEALQGAGADKQATLLAGRTAARAPLHNALDVHVLVNALRRVGAGEHVTTLLNRDPATLTDSEEITVLLDILQEAGAREQLAALAGRAAATAAVDDPRAVARLLRALRRAGAGEHVTTLLSRDPAAHVALEHPRDVARLLDVLQEAGATEQITTLLSRDPATHAPLDHPYDASRLLEALQKADAREQVSVLIDRLPGEGTFEIWIHEEDHLERFKFGRETDGRPSQPWSWDDLE